jgi:glutamine synthetase
VGAETGWVLCDVHFADGRPVPFATRNLYKKVLGDLGARGWISSPVSKSNFISSTSRTTA